MGKKPEISIRAVSDLNWQLRQARKRIAALEAALRAIAQQKITGSRNYAKEACKTMVRIAERALLGGPQ